ncbi:MAG: ComEA family DNA-binding protein [Eubacterium sp.]|nr:ComEA family DNA-binding protein [Eubacterium sp.]
MKKGKRPVYAVVAAAGVLLVIFAVFAFVYANNIDDRNLTYSAPETLYPVISAVEVSRVDINTAPLKELANIDGVGRSRAQDIIRYREEHGGFTELEELKNLPSFDDAAYEKVKDNLCIGRADTVTETLPESDRVNLNTANIRQLMTVPAITQKIAESIIEYRETYGDFISVRELLEIDGIGEITYRKIEGYVTVG